MKKSASIIAIFVGMVSGVAQAQGLSVARHLSGYTCMSLNLTEQELMDGSVPVPVRSDPSPSAPQVGVAAAMVAVREPVTVVNGFVEMLFPNGRTVWVQSGVLKPWKSANNPKAKCYPSLMSNGKPGFDFTG